MFIINIEITYLELFLIVLNIITFLIYGYDKIIAIKDKPNSKRVSEKSLLIFAFIGGSIGALLAMILFRHKIKKLSFILKYISIVLIQIFVIYYLITQGIM